MNFTVGVAFSCIINYIGTSLNLLVFVSASQYTILTVLPVVLLNILATLRLWFTIVYIDIDDYRKSF